MVKSWSASRRARSILCLLGALFCAWVLNLHPADARPGGGQNYRAPSRSSSSSRSYSAPSRSYSGSSSSSSYHGSSGSSYPSSSGPTVVYIPGGGGSGCGGMGLLVVLGIIIVLVYFYYSSQQERMKRVRATIASERSTADQGLAALRSQDPEFEPQAFAERTRTVVKKVNETWLAGDMGPARQIISDGVYVRFTTQLALLHADGLRNAMADWRVISAEILAAESDPMWDTIHMKIVCAARDLDLPQNLTQEQSKKRLSAAPLDEYEEVWSFVRRRGKHSKKGVPALEGHCPNCGADMPRSEVVKCEYCQALVNSGEHDWVLAEITQPEEWRPGAALGEVPGLFELRQRDPSVSRQELEDRASVVFWKWVEARSTGKIEKLARFCIRPPTDAGNAAELGLGTNPAKLRQVAVGSAELKLASIAADSSSAVIEIRWSASVDGAEPAFDIHEFVLSRSTGAVSKRGLSSLDCPVCGGQLAASDATTCSYCGTTLYGGKHEWALAAVRRGELPPDEGFGGGEDASTDESSS